MWPATQEVLSTSVLDLLYATHDFLKMFKKIKKSIG